MKRDVGAIKVLVVDDTPAQLQIAKEWLDSCELTCCTDSGDALVRLASGQNEYDLVITDKDMPHHDGFVVARTARKFHPDCEIWLWTSRSRFEVASEANAAGVDKIVYKDRLQSAIQEAGLCK